MENKKNYRKNAGIPGSNRITRALIYGRKRWENEILEETTLSTTGLR